MSILTHYYERRWVKWVDDFNYIKLDSFIKILLMQI